MKITKDNQKLALCIPTYNRAGILLQTGIHHIELVKDYGFPLIIANNCSPDNTDDTVAVLQKTYPNIEYYKHSQNIKDRNFPFVLHQAKTDYAWLLGDKHKINQYGISRFMEVVEHENYDLIVTNHDMRVKDIPTTVYTEPEKLLRDLGWHMTDITSLIFSKQFIEQISFERFSETNFMHVGGIFEALAHQHCKVLWINENWFEKYRLAEQSGWYSELFEVWANSWPLVILSLPPCYSLSSKTECLKKNNDNIVLSYRRIKHHRRNGIYNYAVYKKYYPYLRLCSSIPRWYYLLMSVCPIVVLRIHIIIRNMFKSIFRKHK